MLEIPEKIDKLSEARYYFCQLKHEFETWLNEKGYIWYHGEGADFVTAKDPSTDHMNPGLHGLGLAQDYVFCIRDANGNLQYLKYTESYQDAGEKWESMDPRCHWGGRFERKDGNHISFSDPSIPGCMGPKGLMK